MCLQLPLNYKQQLQLQTEVTATNIYEKKLQISLHIEMLENMLKEHVSKSVYNDKYTCQLMRKRSLERDLDRVNKEIARINQGVFQFGG